MVDIMCSRLRKLCGKCTGIFKFIFPLIHKSIVTRHSRNIAGRSCQSKSPEYEKPYQETEASENVDKKSKAIASMCLNIGGKPPSRTSSISDEGGFNEPSPEIKARLKPPIDNCNYNSHPPKPPDITSPNNHHQYIDNEDNGYNDTNTPDSCVITNSVLAELESHNSPLDVYRPLYVETTTNKTDYLTNTDNLINSNKLSSDERSHLDNVSAHQDSGVLISEASQGSMEILDKSMNSQWSMQSEDLLRADSSLHDPNATSITSLNEYPKCENETSAAEELGSEKSFEADLNSVNKGPDNMTPAEAEMMLSSR